jgi:phosphate transport system substrate-binding protein
MAEDNEKRRARVRSRSYLTAAALMAVALSVFAAACGGGGKKSIDGAGATFPQPVYDQWASNLKKDKDITVNYNPVGSGGGVAQFTAGTVDFGASDPPLKPEEITAASKKGQPLMVPTVFGAVTISYNLPGVKTGLKLDGATAADIFLGKVKKWNDQEIASLNPGVKLPSTSITIVHRSDESGTTKLFTTFLSDYSPTWKSQVGADKKVKWPTGTGAKGNAGVAGGVKQTTGSVGYVEEAYALQNNFTTADVKNKAGKFIAPSLASTTAAGVGIKVPANLGIDAVNAPGAAAYPIASATHLLVYQDMCKAGLKKSKAESVKAWLDYALGAGQAVARTLQYAPLPPAILSKAQAEVAGLTCNGQPLKAAS